MLRKTTNTALNKPPFHLCLIHWKPKSRLNLVIWYSLNVARHFDVYLAGIVGVIFVFFPFPHKLKVILKKSCMFYTLKILPKTELLHVYDCYLNVYINS